jgi:O-antigen ligase
MISRLTKYADALMETAWLLALILAPLFFDVYSQRVFEPDKISLVRTVALFGLIAGVVKLFETWRVRGDDEETEQAGTTSFWRKPLVWPVLALMAAYLLSTIFSVVPRQSFWGSYQRLQGTFTMLSYIVLFFITLSALQREGQWRRFQYTVILVSLPIALYGIIQHYQLDPLPWGGDTTQRVAGNMGNSIFLAAYLIMAMPLTLERLIHATRKMLLDEQGSVTDALVAGALLFVLVIQALAILFTQSRGPWIGLAMGLYVFGLLVLTSLRQQAGGHKSMEMRDILLGAGMGLLGLAVLAGGLIAMSKLSGVVGGLLLLLALGIALALYLIPLFRKSGWRWLWLSFITQSLVVAVLVVLLNLSPAFLPGFRDIPYVGRLAQLMDFENGTGRVRVLIWQGVVDMMLKPHDPLQFPDGHTDALNPVRPLIGYGPESMWVAYNRFYRPELGELEHRNASPDRAHNETFDSLVNTGILGFLAYFALFFSIKLIKPLNSDVRINTISAYQGLHRFFRYSSRLRVIR